MKKNYTYIAMVLDKSGSMSPLQLETINMVNNYVKSQLETSKAIKDSRCDFMLVTFNDYPVMDSDGNIELFKPITTETYRPDNYTALLDAIGYTVNTLGEKLLGMKEEDRPEKVLCMILTDGLENVSKKFTREQIKTMISHQTTKYNWEFGYMGANQDAFLVSATLNIPTGNTMQFCADPAGMQKTSGGINLSSTNYRSSANYRTGNLFTGITEPAESNSN